MSRKTPKTKTAKKKKYTPIEFYLDRIDPVGEVNVNIPDNFSELGKADFEFDFSAELKLVPEKKSIEILINYRFINGEVALIEMHVGNKYIISNYDDVVQDNKLIDQHFGVYLVDLSAKHCRGVQALATKGTQLAEYPMAHISEQRVLEGLKHV